MPYVNAGGSACIFSWPPVDSRKGDTIEVKKTGKQTVPQGERKLNFINSYKAGFGKRSSEKG